MSEPTVVIAGLSLEIFSFFFYNTAFANLTSKNLLNKWNCLIKHTTERFLEVAENSSTHNGILTHVASHRPTLRTILKTPMMLAMVPETLGNRVFTIWQK